MFVLACGHICINHVIFICDCLGQKLTSFTNCYIKTHHNVLLTEGVVVRVFEQSANYLSAIDIVQFVGFQDCWEQRILKHSYIAFEQPAVAT